MKCVICRQEVNWLLRVNFNKTVYDANTGEKYCFCSKCQRLLNRGRINTLNIPLNLRNWIIDLNKNHIISDDIYEYISEYDANLIASKNGLFASGWVTIRDKYIVIDELHKKIIINNKVYPFDDIISYELFDNSVKYHIMSPESTDIKTHSKNGLARTILGGVITGPAGAIMGGLTSNHNLNITKSGKSEYDQTIHDFSIVIKTNKISCPTIVISIGDNECEFKSVVNLIDAIIHAK